MAHLRKTKSLQIILEAFNTSENALSSVDLVRRFQSEMNKTTVYRVLDRLEKQNLLHSFTDTHGLRCYALTPQHNSQESTEYHSHFQCVVCGKSKCIHVEVQVPSLPNHKVDSASLMLVGHCEDCLV